MNDIVLLRVEQMAAADAAAIASGVSGLDLMEAAGSAVANQIRQRWLPRPVAVLCGPGNNGGDGFVIARLLADDGWPVRLALLGDRKKLKGDAAINAERWSGDIEEVAAAILDDAPLVVDALFGSGLSKPLHGQALSIVEEINSRELDCVAVDMPSGVDGNSGEILGAAPFSKLTVTFFRRKPGHLLLPGRDLMGDLVVADIGIPDHVLEDIAPDSFANSPDLWLDVFPHRQAADNKFTHGHAVVVGGPEMTGAARLAATAARRMGAGLVSIAAPPEAFDIYAAGDPGNIVKAIDDLAAFEDFLSDERKSAILVGPGCGLGPRTRDFVLTALASKRPVVLDADALTVFADDPESLFSAIKASGPVLLTPHEGEFARLFDVTGNKPARARAAAAISGAVVLLKGADTVIADPSGCTVINDNAPPTLATAGSGDVLAGFAVGLVAQGMPMPDAACAAAWLHSRAATAIGNGLIAEDLAMGVSSVLTELQNWDDHSS